MINKHLRFGLFLLVYWGAILSVLGQENILNYSFKKGEVLDILLLTNGSNIAALFPTYKQTAFPVASKYSFKPVPGLPITQTVQGGVQPESMIFGKWASLEKREGFLDVIAQEVPDFHEQRRALWTYFTLTYYEISKDTAFKIDRSKYNVVTSYWGNGIAFDQYIKAFKKYTKQKGGSKIITLTNGHSPAGYAYNPDYLTITQWESKEAFEAFYKSHEAMAEKRIDNVHQFVLN